MTRLNYELDDYTLNNIACFKIIHDSKMVFMLIHEQDRRIENFRRWKSYIIFCSPLQILFFPSALRPTSDYQDSLFTIESSVSCAFIRLGERTKKLNT